MSALKSEIQNVLIQAYKLIEFNLYKFTFYEKKGLITFVPRKGDMFHGPVRTFHSSSN